METGHRVSAVGSPVTLGVWRSTILFLSPGILAPGRGDRRDAPVESGARRVHMGRSDPGWDFHVFAGSRISGSVGCDLCVRTLRCQPLLARHRVLAKCVRRTARSVLASTSPLDGFANG